MRTRRISGGFAVRCIRWFAGVSYEKDDAKLRIANMGGEWIQARERLPDVEDRVLIFCPLLEPDEIIGATMDRAGLWTCDDGQLLGTEEPTHWMPLPEPPTDAK